MTWADDVHRRSSAHCALPIVAAALHAVPARATGRQLPVPPRGQGHDIVAIPATNTRTGLPLLDHRLYIRDRSLRQPIRQIANYLAADESSCVQRIFAIQAHLIVPDGSTRPTVTNPAIQAVINAAWTAVGPAFFAYHWTGPADLYVLDQPLPCGEQT